MIRTARLSGRRAFAAAGSSFSTQPGEVDVLAGGADIWGTADQGHVTLAPRSGNFDISVQVPLLQRNGTTDTISKAGLMVRENLNADSRSMYWNVNPPASIGGRDIYEAGQRPVVAGATAAFLDGGAANTLGGIPNAWLRLQRIGNTFIAYRSTNGVDWIAATTNVVVYPDRVYIGLGTTAMAPMAFAAPLLGGLLADGVGFRAMFVVALAFALSGLVLLAALVRDPRHAAVAVRESRA